ncbi:BamA/TamA family outer membrane protein [Candidatus Dependentiae bacterium]|nr:BamA/TamA family outer membrane protein [Candidatus Dependentiae bacterium]
MRYRALSLLILLPLALSTTLVPLHGNRNKPSNQPTLATKITFQADVPFSKKEFFYLTDLYPNRGVTTEQLTHACKQLKRKNRFNTIETIVTDGKNGKYVHFKLNAHWIFKKLQVSGIWFGKQAYKNLYLQHPGEIFDGSLHEEALITIKKQLHQNGYFSCTLQDELVYDTKEKSITVKIKILRGPQARIDNIKTTPQLEKLSQQLESLLLYKRYSKGLLNKAKERIKTFLTKQGFTKHRISLKQCIKNKNSRVSLLFEIVMRTKRLFAFQGNHFFSKKQITKSIINLDRPEWLLDPNIIAEQIIHAYHQYGFWNARISYKKYAFTIREGPRASIKNVIVRDVETGREEKNKFFFNPVLQAKHYDKTLLDTCVETLKNFYVEHGFWNFSIIDQQIKTEKKPNRYSLLLSVKRGPQQFLNKKPFNPKELSQQRSAILEQYQQQGFWYVDVQPNITSDVIQWDVAPGERVSFGKVFVRGTSKLPFGRIVQEASFKPGDPWDKKKFDLFRKRLKNLAVFKHIEIHAKNISGKQSKKPIVLTLIDDDPFELKLRSGYFLTSKNFLLKRESTYKLGGSLLIKNPLNLADKLSFNVNATRFEKNLDFSYQVPHPFRSPVVAKCNAYYHQYIHPLEAGKSDSAYEAIQKGLLVGITKEYKSCSFWGVTIGNEWMRTSRARGNIKLAQSMINTTIPYLFIEPNLLIDHLDDKINTTKGSLTFCSIKIMVPQTNRSTTCKIMTDHAQFYHLGRQVVGALRIRGGHIFRENFEEIMPIERFYLGGPLSVRGYSKDTVPPLGKTDKNEYTIQGGNSMINCNIELRFPIYKALGGVLFQDVGALGQCGFFQFASWAPTSGCGLRYQTPIGALRFDIGWKWKKSFPTDSRYAWYLTLGQAF